MTERHVSIFLSSPWAIPVRQGKFKRRERHQFAGLDQVEIDPGEDVQLQGALEFAGHDIRNRSAQTQIHDECSPFSGVREGHEAARIAWHRPGNDQRTGRLIRRKCDRVEKVSFDGHQTKLQKLRFTRAAGIIIHPFTHFDAFLTAPLFDGDPAVEKAHVTLGKCPHMSVIVLKPSGHFLFFLRVCLH